MWGWLSVQGCVGLCWVVQGCAGLSRVVQGCAVGRVQQSTTGLACLERNTCYRNIYVVHVMMSDTGDVERAIYV
jgi:hypothetical protein